MNKVEKLNGILSAFKIAAVCKNYSEYKSSCFYDIELAPGTKIKDIEKFSSELSLALKKGGKPRVLLQAEVGLLRLEFVQRNEEKLSFFKLGSESPRPEGEITCLLGETLQGQPVWLDLVKSPHILIAGTTGSGKSTLLHTIIANLLMFSKIEIHLMDPKSIEFFQYDGKMPRLNVTYNLEESIAKLQTLNEEMESRYFLMKHNGWKVNNFPYIVLIIDEFADLIMQDTSNQFHKLLCKLAQKSRAAGIHIILATQRPSVDVVDGSIKANFPARIACKVASGVDSRIILDAMGAENLMGAGDALIKSGDKPLERFQAAWTDAAQIIKFFSEEDVN